jgi:hypothetical protein
MGFQLSSSSPGIPVAVVVAVSFAAPAVSDRRRVHFSMPLARHSRRGTAALHNDDVRAV